MLTDDEFKTDDDLRVTELQNCFLDAIWQERGKLDL